MKETKYRKRYTMRVDAHGITVIDDVEKKEIGRVGTYGRVRSLVRDYEKGLRS